MRDGLLMCLAVFFILGGLAFTNGARSQYYDICQGHASNDDPMKPTACDPPIVYTIAVLSIFFYAFGGFLVWAWWVPKPKESKL